MTDSIANANGQGPTTIMVSGGKEYILAPLRMEDMGEVETFAKERHRQEGMAFIRELGDLVSPEDKGKLLSDLRKELLGSISKKDLDAGCWSWMMSITSPAVISFAVVLRLRKANPELTEDEARSLVTAKAIADMEGTMSELVGLDSYSASLGPDEDDTEKGGNQGEVTSE